MFNGSCSLYLRYNHDIDSEYNPKFLIKFYDKVAEYYKRHKTYICHLQEPLTEYEKSLVGSAYDEEKNTLNLEGFNILRVEIEFHGSEKIKPTDYWKDHEITEGEEYAILTNIIHQEWSGCQLKNTRI